MARTAIPIIVLDLAGNARQGASVTVKNRATNTNATVYASETGSATVPNPLSTDQNGAVAGWVERGSYVASITGTVLGGALPTFESTPGADGSVDGAWLASSVLPIGSILDYGGAGDPAGGSWLVCDGRAVSRTTYAALYQTIGTRFGAGDGSTTFNLPDFRGRVAVGYDSAGINLAISNDLGQRNGYEYITLTTAQMPSHSHGGLTGGMDRNNPHAHTQNFRSGGSGSSNVHTSGTADTQTTNQTAWPTETQDINHFHPITAEGGGGQHYNMPPYLCTAKIIRVR